MQIVLNVEYGGFSFDNKMASWLKKNKGWNLYDEKDMSYSKDKKGLIKVSDHYYYSYFNDEISLRTDPDLIECVLALKAEIEGEYENSNWRETQEMEQNNKVLNLAVKEYHVELEISSYDGKEKLLGHIVID